MISALQNPKVTECRQEKNEVLTNRPQAYRESDENVNYVLVGESGPDHNKTFEVEVHLNSNVIGKGKGGSKKSAEQAAAREALKLMGVI